LSDIVVFEHARSVVTPHLTMSVKPA